MNLLASKTANMIENLKEKVEKSLHPSFAIYELKEIMPRIFFMSFPTPQLIEQMSENLNKRFKNDYFIWNLAEETYDIQFFNKQVLKKNN